MKTLRMNLVLPLVLMAVASSAGAETVGSNPSWDITKIDAPAGEEGADGPVYFTMAPDDGRPAITIDSASATRIINGEVAAESVYSRSKGAVKGVAKKNASGGWLQIADPIYSTATKEDQPEGYDPYAGMAQEAKPAARESLSALPSSGAAGSLSSAGAYNNNGIASSGASMAPMASHSSDVTDNGGAGSAGGRDLASENDGSMHVYNPLAPPKSAIGIAANKVGDFSAQKVAITPTAPPPPAPVPVTTCEEATKQKAMKNGTRSVTFASTKGQSCAWGQNNNLSKNNGKHTARREQTQKLDLPAGAVLCNMKISSDGGTIKYDDAFFLTFNDYVIASNAKPAVDKLTRENVSATNKTVPLYKYDWLKIRGSDTSESNYCVGSAQSIASCSWPQTEQSGAFKLTYNSDLIRKISDKGSAGEQELTFIVTGDDDASSDCQHSGVELDIAIDFFTPGSAAPAAATQQAQTPAPSNSGNVTAPPTQVTTVKCESTKSTINFGGRTISSNNYVKKECSAGANIEALTVITKNSRCQESNSYGYSGTKVWVDKGCEATFAVTHY